jgi:adenylate kinase family enzyme
MQRVVVIGNSGGGKSTLARRLAARLGLVHHEVDGLLWQPGWVPTPADTYEAEHARLIGGSGWVIDGLGRRDSIAARLERATDIVLIDMPLWMHFWLAAERQIAWPALRPEERPAGLLQAPPTEALFRTIWVVDRDWMPGIRAAVTSAEQRGASVSRIASVSGIDAFMAGVP